MSGLGSIRNQLRNLRDELGRDSTATTAEPYTLAELGAMLAEAVETEPALEDALERTLVALERLGAERLADDSIWPDLSDDELEAAAEIFAVVFEGVDDVPVRRAPTFQPTEGEPE